MKTMFRGVTVSIGVGVLGAIFATQAGAGSPAAFVQVADQDSDDVFVFGPANIVGLWKFTFTAQGNTNGIPDGAPIDAGFVTWHRDRTELMNSGRAPTTGDFCMGVWKRVGRSTYKLNHVALAWAFNVNAPVTAPGTGGADFIGPASIQESITVDRGGHSYTGTFTLTQFAQDGTTVLPGTPIVGTVTATRITVD